MPEMIDALPDGRQGYATGRGTAALMAAVSALDLPGREVLAPVNLCPIAIAGLLWAGARPRLHDVDPASGNARLEDVAAAWAPTCAGVLVVHNFGQPVAIDVLADWSAAQGLRVIEDCCNAAGASWQGMPLGAWGDAAIYAFGPGKTVDAGGGGALSAADPVLLDRLRREIDAMPVLTDMARLADKAMEASLSALRPRGTAGLADQRRVYEAYGPNAATRLDAVAAERVRAALTELPRIAALRRERAAWWRARFDGTAAVPMEDIPGAIPWRFNIRVAPGTRDQIVADLREAGFPASTWYPSAASLFEGEAAVASHYPGAENFAAAVINLWVDDTLDHAAVQAAADLILARVEAAA